MNLFLPGMIVYLLAYSRQVSNIYMYILICHKCLALITLSKKCTKFIEGNWVAPVWLRLVLLFDLLFFISKCIELHCTSQAFMPCSCPALRPKKKKKKKIAGKQQQRHQVGSLRSLTHKVLKQYPTMYRSQQAKHSNNLYYSGEKEAPFYRGNWCQVGSSVTRATSRGQAHRLLLIKPCN